MKIDNIFIPDTLYAEMISAAEIGILERSPGVDAKTLVINMLSNSNCFIDQFLVKILSGHGKNKKDLKYFELGAGYGVSLLRCLQNGYNIIATEPSIDGSFGNRYHIAKEILSSNGISNISEILYNDYGEDLQSVETHSIDVVYSMNVLEHVENIDAVIKEIDRILKPGGIAFLTMPNYWSWYEGHYRCWWFPLLSLNKNVAKFYIKLRGRNPFLVDQLNFTTPGMIRKKMKKIVSGTIYAFPFFKKMFRNIARVYYHIAVKAKDARDDWFAWLSNVVNNSRYRKIALSILWLCLYPGMLIGTFRNFSVVYYKSD